MSVHRDDWAGPALGIAALAIWAACAVLPAWDAPPGTPVRIREAWDTQPYWAIGVPVLVVAQLAAAATTRNAIWRQSLWIVAGQSVGLLLFHERGADLGLLPLSILFVGLPFFFLFLATAGLGRFAGRLFSRVSGEA